jgi:hypothetical protein
MPEVNPQLSSSIVFFVLKMSAGRSAASGEQGTFQEKRWE